MSATRYLGTVAACAVLALTSACGAAGDSAAGANNGSTGASEQ